MFSHNIYKFIQGNDFKELGIMKMMITIRMYGSLPNPFLVYDGIDGEDSQFFSFFLGFTHNTCNRCRSTTLASKLAIFKLVKILRMLLMVNVTIGHG